MKKTIALILFVSTMLICFSGCEQQKGSVPKVNDSAELVEYVKGLFDGSIPYNPPDAESEDYMTLDFLHTLLFVYSNQSYIMINDEDFEPELISYMLEELVEYITIHFNETVDDLTTKDIATWNFDGMYISVVYDCDCGVALGPHLGLMDPTLTTSPVPLFINIPTQEMLLQNMPSIKA